MLNKFHFLFFSILYFSAPLFANDDFVSPVFSYDQVKEAKGCHVLLRGTTPKGLKWVARDVNPSDIPYLVKGFGNQKVMQFFAGGNPIPEEKVRGFVEEYWIPRFKNGHPHGALIIKNEDTGERIGYFIAGPGDQPGESELGGFMMEESWNGKGQPAVWRQGVMSSVMTAFFDQWLPEVMRIPEDETVPEAIRQAFCCFKDMPLRRLFATASPTNAGSVKLLLKSGFEPALSGLEAEGPIVDFKGESYTDEEFEELLLCRFSSFAENPLEKGKRYKGLGPEGQLFVFACHKTYDRIKLYFEKNVATSTHDNGDKSV